MTPGDAVNKGRDVPTLTGRRLREQAAIFVKRRGRQRGVSVTG